MLYTRELLEEMSDDDLLKAKDILTLKRIDCDSQITEAKEKTFQNISVDPTWYGKVKKAKGVTAFFESIAQQIISKRKQGKEMRKSLFIEVAERELDKELYNSLWDEVWDKVGGVRPK